MDGAGNHLLAGAGFAHHQHSRGMTSHLLYQLHDALQGVAADNKTGGNARILAYGRQKRSTPECLWLRLGYDFRVLRY